MHIPKYFFTLIASSSERFRIQLQINIIYIQHTFQYISSKFIKEDAALSTDTALDCERSRTCVGDGDGCADRGGAAAL